MDDATLLAKFGESGAPNRACNLMLKLGADTPGAAADALRNLAFLIDTGGLTHGFSAGYSSSYTYDWQAGESPTHDEWAASSVIRIGDACRLGLIARRMITKRDKGKGGTG